MQVYGLEKIRIFQDFYFEQNGVEISYPEAVRLFYHMDSDTKSEFEEYYKDETGYEIISANGFDLESNTDIKTQPDKNGVEKVVRVNGKVVRTKTTTNSDGTTTTIENYVAQTTKNAINTKYTLEGFMKEQGMVLDPQWAGFSAEEIMQMVDNGVNVPQEVVDIANSILQSSGVALTDGNEDTTEKEPFLELVPKAIEHIKDCKETQESISDEIEALLPEKQKREKSLSDKLKEQKNSLKDYKDLTAEWQSLKDKMENGEKLSERESKRYSELSEMLGAKKDATEDAGIDKKEIASSLSEINILALLGEQLADKTIEIGETLEDYTSETNYTQTSKEVSAAVGPFYTYIAMAHGKYIGEEAVKIGNETKEYTEETATSVSDIAETLDITDSIATVDEEGNIVNPEPSENTNEKQTDKKKKKNEFAFITDARVLAYIIEAKEINSELYKQINIALEQIKIAKKDVKFAKVADKVITKVVNEFIKEEKIRQEEIKKEEEQKKEAEKIAKQAQDKIDDAQTEIIDAQAEIQELEANKEVNKKYAAPGSNINNEIDAEIQEQEAIIETQEGIIDEQNPIIETQNKIIEVHNKEIEKIQIESQKAKEEVKQKTLKEKKGIDKATKVENNSLKINTEYQEKDLPEHNERMDFIHSAGLALVGIGTGFITIGARNIMLGTSLMGCIFTYPEGVALVNCGIVFVLKGTMSIAIGTAACVVSDDESLIEEAEETTDSAGNNINHALTNLNGVNNKLASVIEEYSTDEEKGGAENAQGTQGAENAENAEENNPADATEGTEGTDTAEPASTPSAARVNSNQSAAFDTIETPIETTKENETVSNNTTPAVETSDEKTAGTANPAVKNQTVNNQENNPASSRKVNDEKTNLKPEANATQTAAGRKGSAPSKQKYDENCDSGPVKDKQEQETDKAEDKLDSIDSATKNDAKESQNIEKDTKKDKKQLEKETKKLVKKLKKDEENIKKMTKQSVEAAKKQAEILVEYETIKTENEKMMAEDEAKAASNEAMGAPQKEDGQNNQNSVAASNNFAMGGQESENTDKLEQNSQRITTLSGEFKTCTRIITTNQGKIKQLQKSTKKTQKKFNKKTKILNKKIKEDQKAEDEKQKRLAKQLAVVGIQENIFSLTSSIGTIWQVIATGELCNPFTAIKGGADMTVAQILMAIGAIGSLACEVTKSIINLAHGNLSAALMGLGTTAVAVAANFVPAAGGAVNKILTCVTEGLKVVSTSTEFVNNVRAVQGKEAIGALSKISTVAGAASALTDMAGSFAGGGFQDASTFGKAMKVASAVGTTMSTTSQLMSEFGADGKAAQILGTIGGAVQLGASIGQLAESAKNKDDAKKSEKTDNNQNSEQKTDSNSNKTEIKDGKLVINGKEVELPEGCTIEGGKVLDKDKNEVKVNAEGKITETKKETQKTKETPEEKKMRKEQEKLEKEQKTQQKQQQKEQNKKELEEAKLAKKQKQEEAKKVSNKKMQKNMVENGASEEFAAVETDDLEIKLDNAKQAGDATKVKQLESELNNRKAYKNKMGLLAANREAKQKTISNVVNMAGQAASTVMSMFASTQSGEDSTQKKKYAAPGTLTKRTKDIMKKNKKFRERRVQALAKSQRYYA